MQKSKIVWTSLTVVGVVLVVLGVGLGYGVFPAVIKSQVAKELDLLDHESEGYKNFVNIFCAFLIGGKSQDPV